MQKEERRYEGPANEIRVSGKTNVFKAFERIEEAFKTHDKVILSGINTGISKVLLITEITKLKIGSLHQYNWIETLKMESREDNSETKEESKRFLTRFKVELFKMKPSTPPEGFYQEPYTEDERKKLSEIKPQGEDEREEGGYYGRGGRGRGRGRGRGGYNNYEGRGRGGRGRGRGGYDRDYRDYREDREYSGRGRGGDRGERRGGDRGERRGGDRGDRRGGDRGGYRGRGENRGYNNQSRGNDSYRGGNDSYRGGNDSYRGGNDSYRGGNDSYRGGNDSYRGNRGYGQGGRGQK